MRKKWLLLPLIVVLLSMAAAMLVTGEGSCGGIVVTGANAMRCDTTSGSSALDNWLDMVADRIVYQYSNANRENIMTSSTMLEGFLAQVDDRLTFQYADANRQQSLTASTTLEDFLGTVADRVFYQHADANRQEVLLSNSTLNSWLEQVADRVFLQYADANQQDVLAFPIGIVDDFDPPVMTSIEDAQTAGNQATISWNTNELADSKVNYGTSPGNYTGMKYDFLVVLAHEIVIDGLAPGTYYYQVVSTDRSGNVAVSAEKSFTISPQTPTPTATATPTVTPTPTPTDESDIYLPVVVK